MIFAARRGEFWRPTKDHFRIAPRPLFGTHRGQFLEPTGTIFWDAPKRFSGAHPSQFLGRTQANFGAPVLGPFVLNFSYERPLPIAPFLALFWTDPSDFFERTRTIFWCAPRGIFGAHPGDFLVATQVDFERGPGRFFRARRGKFWCLHRRMRFLLVFELLDYNFPFFVAILIILSTKSK